MKFRGAIAGFGNIAVNGHLPGYRENGEAEIIAVMDVMPQAEESCRKELPGARFYNDLAEMLRAEELDFVDVATPPGTHAENIIRCLENNTNVICEKPLVLDSTEYSHIAELSASRNCVVYTVHNWRYAPIFAEASGLISKGAVGEVNDIEYLVYRTRPSVTSGESGVEDNWRIDPLMAGGGILVDHGWHAFYMVNQWTSKTPRWIECQLSNRKFTDIPLEDTAEVNVGYDSQVRARLFFTWAAESRSNRVVIGGNRGNLIIDDDTIVLDSEGGKRTISFPQALSQGSHHPDWYSAVFADFFSELRDMKKRGENFQEAGWCQKMMEGCVLSNRKGEKIWFEEMPGHINNG